jgi:hypothetical protein
MVESMQNSRRYSKLAVAGLLIAGPLFSAVIFASVAVAIAAAVGASHTFGIGVLVAVIVGAVNATALCMAIALGENGARVIADPAIEANGNVDYARAS